MGLAFPGWCLCRLSLRREIASRGLFYPVEVSDWTFCATRFRQLMASMPAKSERLKSGIAFAFWTDGFYELTTTQAAWERMVRQSMGARE